MLETKYFRECLTHNSQEEKRYNYLRGWSRVATDCGYRRPTHILQSMIHTNISRN